MIIFVKRGANMDVGKYVVISVIIFSVVFAVVRTLILESNSMKLKHQKLDKWEKELSEKSSMLTEWQNDLSRWQLAQVKASNSIDRIVNVRLADAITKGAKKQIFKNTPVFLAFSNLDLDEKSRLYSAIRTRLISDTPTVTWNVESSNDKYVVSLTKCTCKDYQVRKKPCKHMMRLGLELGLLQYADDSDIISKLNDLEDLQREVLRDKQRISELYTTVNYRCKKREEQCKAYIQSYIKDSCKDIPEEYVASLISGLSDIFDDEIIYYLDTKDHPAYLTAVDIKNYYKERNSKLVFRLTKAESELKHCQKKLKDMQKQTTEQTKLAL